jgi:hypothetical protein
MIFLNRVIFNELVCSAKKYYSGWQIKKENVKQKRGLLHPVRELTPFSWLPTSFQLQDLPQGTSQ